MHQEIPDGTVTSPLGFTAGVAACGIKKNDKLDVSLLYAENDCTAAGVFTKNQVVAAPVIVDRETLAVNKALIRGVLTNAGNANAATGSVGLQNARRTQKILAQQFGLSAPQFLVLSTGVIGVQLPMDKLEQGIHTAAADLARAHGAQAAEAICTTDTFVKQCAVTVELAGGPVTIGGMAKGAGMIHPNMATMLGVITTDAAVDADILPGLLQAATDESFNRISVDGDTSTNDTVLLLASGASGVDLDRSDWSEAGDYAKFSAALTAVCQKLAQLIVRDGEGATKFVELTVSGARNKAEAHQIANTIAMSPLVKTALAGSDANWGRIMMAAGKAGVSFDPLQTTLRVGNDGEQWLTLLADGLPTDYEEKDAAAVFAEADIHIWLQLEEGHAASKVWTCDLTHDYVTINADYRT